jgi:Fe-S-cluster containining protein
MNLSDPWIQAIRLAVISTTEQPGTEDFLENGKWACNGCGACCENVQWCLPHWMVEGTTRCKHLTPDKQCEIYEDRPKICRMNQWPNPPDEYIAKACAYMRNTQYGETPPESE